MDAINRVVEIARNEVGKDSRRRRLCVLVAVDVKNAFSTVPWHHVHEALRRKAVPRIIRDFMKGYLSDREIKLEGDVILGMEMPHDVTTIAFAYDRAVVAVERREEDLTAIVDYALDRICRWIRGKGMRVAPEKTEAVMLVGRKRHKEMSFRVEEVEVVPSKTIMYLRVWLD